MSGRHYCTYFDHRYLARGLAMHASLTRHAPDALLWVLCLSPQCHRALTELALPGIRPVALEELERFDPELAAARGNRSLVEYYFTCSPCLPRYVFAEAADAELVTYLDADLYFFASPEPLFQSLASDSVAICPHRFTARTRRSHGRFGEYNVGWVSFRRDGAGLACLDWWRGQCLAWCHDRVEGDRYADQKYLDQFQARFPGVHVVRHPGANLAPWNVGGCVVTLADGNASVDGEPLLFFHFQGLRPLRDGSYDSNLTGYGARMTPALREGVFQPYVAALEATQRRLVSRGLVEPDQPGVRRATTGLIGRLRALKSRFATIRARWAGNVVSP